MGEEKVGERHGVRFCGDFFFINTVIIAEHRAARHRATYETRQHHYDDYDEISSMRQWKRRLRGETHHDEVGGDTRTILAVALV